MIGAAAAADPRAAVRGAGIAVMATWCAAGTLRDLLRGTGIGTEFDFLA